MIQFNPDDPLCNAVKKEMLFSPGELVEHVRYGYLGVVVATNMIFKADEMWYQTNMTHPSKNQPWYHILVHNSETVTYVAQSNLIRLHTDIPINHALVQIFFEAFVPSEHRYIRNNTPWEHYP